MTQATFVISPQTFLNGLVVLETPFRVMVRLLNGSRGARMRLNWKSAPVWSGQNSGGITNSVAVKR